MATGDEELLAELRSNLDNIQGAAQLARERARDARTTLQDKAKMLSVTVGGYGDLHQITIHGDAYRDLPPAELADLIVKTAQRARTEAQQAAMAFAPQLTGDLVKLGDRARQAKSIEDLVESVVGLVSSASPRRDGTGAK